MIGIIRVQLTTNPNATVWSDQEWQRLMDPSVPFSLAHYWRKCSFGLADLSYRLFPSVLVEDPKPNMTAEQIQADPQFRSTRVKAITTVVDDQYHPNWGAFSTLLIWIASPFDLFGTSAFDHGKGVCGLMMCHIASRFDQMCHELGHTLGFDHPFGREGIEYKSAYDIMGGYDSSWTRSNILGFPQGATTPPTSDPLLLIGPMISAAQLSMSGYRPLLPGLFAELLINFLSAPQDIQISAFDQGTDIYPQIAGPVAAVLPPDPISPDYHYVIELRRKRGYDSNIVGPSVVVHGYNAIMKRFFYAGALPLSNRVGDTDLHIFSGLPGSDITLRLLEVGPDDMWARIRVGGPNYWRNFGVDISPQDHADEPQHTDWTQVEVKPCVFAATGIHYYRYNTTAHTYGIDATSFGYEAPHYTWILNGETLQESGSSVKLSMQTSVPDPIKGWQNLLQDITFRYTIDGAHLDLNPQAVNLVKLGKFSVTLQVVVNETSGEVIKNNYPDQTVTTSLSFKNVEIEWDADYQDKLKYCESVVHEVDRKRIPVHLVKIPGEGRVDDGLSNVINVINSVIDTNPALANALIDHVSRTTNLTQLQVIARLQQNR